MPVYALGALAPQVDPAAYIHPSAELIGDVVVHAHASVWPGAVLRADLGRIEVGEGTAVEDNVVVHPRGPRPTSIGPTRSSGTSPTWRGWSSRRRCSSDPPRSCSRARG